MRQQRYFLLPGTQALEWVEFTGRASGGRHAMTSVQHGTIDGEPISDAELRDLLAVHGLLP